MIEAEACGIMSGGEPVEPDGWAGVDSVGGGQAGHWNTERERLWWFEANLDAHREHAVELFVREVEVAPGL